MNTLRDWLTLSAWLIALFLIAKNASGVATVMQAFGEQFTSSVKSLQGR